MTNPDFPRQLDEIAAGFMRSQVLFTALRGNMFQHLQAPAALEDVATKLGWNAKGTRMLLDGLVALNLVGREEGRYVNLPVAAQCLVPGAPMDQTHILTHKGHGWETWSSLGEAVQLGDSVQRPRPERSPEQLRAFICGMADIARQSAQSVLEVFNVSRFSAVLDVGGGPGTYSLAFLKAHPPLRATIMDLVDVLPIAQEQAAAAGLADRVSFQAGDLTRDPLPEGHDLHFVSNIIHSYSVEENRDLVRRSHEALAPGGTLVIKDFLVEPDRTGPPWALMFALHMLIHTGKGDAYTTEEVKEWTDAAGFGPGELLDLTPNSRMWVVRKG